MLALARNSVSGRVVLRCAPAVRTRQVRVRWSKEDRQLELEARIAAKTEQLLALENKVQALEALQKKQLKAAAVLRQIRMTELPETKSRMEGHEQLMQHSMSYKNAPQAGPQ